MHPVLSISIYEASVGGTWIIDQVPDPNPKKCILNNKQHEKMQNVEMRNVWTKTQQKYGKTNSQKRIWGYWLDSLRYSYRC